MNLINTRGVNDKFNDKFSQIPYLKSHPNSKVEVGGSITDIGSSECGTFDTNSFVMIVRFTYGNVETFCRLVSLSTSKATRVTFQSSISK